MANRAVVGLAALGAVFYMGNEALKERECQQEAKEEEQRQMERTAEIEEMLLQEEKRKQRQGVKKNQREGDFMDHFEFSMQREEGLRELLIELLQQIRHKALQPRSSLAGNLRGLQLPALGNGCENTPDEIAFAAALALGDSVILRELFARKIIKSSPDLVLATLNHSSLELIRTQFCHRFESVKATTRSDLPVSKLNSDIVHEFAMVMKSLQEDHTKPFLFEFGGTPLVAAEIEVLATEMGLFVFPTDSFGETHSILRDGTGFTRYHFDRRLRRRSSTSSRYVNNFPAASLDFDVPFGCQGSTSIMHDRGGIDIIYDRGSIEIARGKVFRPKPPCRNNMNAYLQLIIAFTFSQYVEVAMRRLEALGRGMSASERISVEFIAVASGGGIQALKFIRNEYLEMMENNKEKLETSLTQRLQQCVPAPSVDSKARHRLSDTADDVAQKEKEVKKFVKDYVRLLDLSYCVVPTSKGKHPSRCVPQSTVESEARKEIFETQPMPRKNLQRSIELDERSRLVRSRKIVAPPLSTVVFCFLILCSACYWLWYASWCSFFQRNYRENDLMSLLVHTMCLLMALWTVDSALGSLEFPLHVRKQIGVSEISRFHRKWITINNLSELLNRQWRLMLGRRTPFEEEMNRLTCKCRLQHRQWVARSATMDFYEALGRKSITGPELRALLMAFATETSETIKVTLPGTVEEAKEFTRLEVVNETRNKAPKRGKNDAFCIEMLAHVTQEVTSTLDKFPVGQRVVVESSPITSVLSQVTMLVHHQRLGTVVASYLGVVAVLMDGENRPVQLPDTCCHPFEEDHRDYDEEFPKGSRVVVDWDMAGETWSTGPPSESHEVIATYRSRYASVMSSYPGLIMVQVDGEMHRVLVRSHACTLMREEVSTDGPHRSITQDFFGGREVEFYACALMLEVSTEQNFAVGRKVVVEIDNGTRTGDRKAIGWVIACFAGVVVVRLERDGTKVDVPVQNCSLYDDEDAITIDGIEDENLEDVSEDLQPAFVPAETVEEALRKGGWVLKRQKKHLVYECSKKSASGSTGGKTFVMASTPSDQRAHKNSLALLNRLNKDQHNASGSASESNMEIGRRCERCQVFKTEAEFSRSQLEEAFQQMQGMHHQSTITHNRKLARANVLSKQRFFAECRISRTLGRGTAACKFRFICT